MGYQGLEYFRETSIDAIQNVNDIIYWGSVCILIDTYIHLHNDTTCYYEYIENGMRI